MAREDYATASKKYTHVCQEKEPFNQEYPSFLSKVLGLMKKGSIYLYNRIKTVIVVTAILGYFGITNWDIISGVSDISMGEPTGVLKLFKSNFTGVAKEAANVARGVDPQWTKYQEDTEVDLSKDFTYLGDGNSITKTTITKEQMESDFPRASYGDALDYCKNKYGDRSRIPTYNELQKVIGKINPLNKIKIVKGYTPEWTSTVDPNDNDDYKVFFKTKEQKQDYRSIYPEGKGVYVDADTDGGLAFRCYIEIN
jgi:hypothetical protein